MTGRAMSGRRHGTALGSQAGRRGGGAGARESGAGMQAAAGVGAVAGEMKRRG